MPTNNSPPEPEIRHKNHRRYKPSLAQRFYGSRPVMIAVSLVLAVILWFVISISIYPTTPRTIYNIPLQIDITGTTAEENGLSVISSDVENVTVQIEGDRSQIGNLTAENLTAAADMSGVSSAGTKTLSIDVTSNDGISFETRSISPSSVEVVFDYVVTETIEIRPYIPNITYDAGCILDEENCVVTPSTIDVTGPKRLLDQVAYCQAESNRSERLSASRIITTDTLQFYSEAGTLVDDTDFEYDLVRFSIEVPVLYQKELNITYQITNAPSDFNLDTLHLTLSEPTILLAASTSAINDIQEFNIGSIALRDIGLDFSQDFEVTIPEGYTNPSGLTSVVLTLDNTGLAQRDFVISEFGVINAPARYNFDVLTSQLVVTMIGPEEIVNEMDSSDITANVDLSSYSIQADSVEGDIVTFNYAPTISCSKYDSVWATGDYRVAVEGSPIVTTTTTTTSATTTTTTTTTTAATS